MGFELGSSLIFSGRSHRVLSESVAQELGTKLGEVEFTPFPDGEIGVQILENVRGRDVFVMQSVANDPNFYLMELLIMVDALKRASAASIVAVLPYFGYCRQDRRGKGREPITAKLVADLLETAGVSGVITLDLHAEQVEGFFNIPVDNVHTHEVFKGHLGSHSVVVAPDLGSIRIAERMAAKYGGDLAIIDKRRSGAHSVTAGALIGDVVGKEVLIVDDMVSTGRTLEMATRVCLEAGASSVSGAVTHMLRIPELSSMKRLLVSDTISHTDASLPSYIQVVSTAPLIARVIACVCGGGSVLRMVS